MPDCASDPSFSTRALSRRFYKFLCHKKLAVLTLLIAVLLPTGPGATLVQNGGGIIITSENADQVVEMLRLGRGPKRDMAVSPQGNVAAVATTIGVWLYDLESGETLRFLEGHTNVVTNVAFAPDGQTVLSASDDSTLRLWDVATGETLQVFEGHGGPVASMAFAPDGTRFASGGPDGVVRIWGIPDE